MVQPSNFSDIEFGLHSNAERYSWAAYGLFGFLSSLIGDTLILIATFRKDAFKLNKLIVVVIQHLSVANIAGAFCFLTVTISILSNSWILGDKLCYVVFYMRYWVYPVGMSLIAVLTTSKVLILKYPLRAKKLSSKRAHQVCCFIWAFSLMNPVLFFAVDKDNVHFDYRIYTCGYGYSADKWRQGFRVLRTIIGMMSLFVPNVVIIATSVPTLRFLAGARKSAERLQGSVPWQGALTVTLTAVVFCISTFPLTVYLVGSNIVKEDPPGLFHVHFYRIALFLTLINTVSNFYICALTTKSFQRFLFSKVRTVTSVSLQSWRRTVQREQVRHNPDSEVTLVSFNDYLNQSNDSLNRFDNCFIIIGGSI